MLCDFLLELGACSAAVTDADAGTAIESPVFADPWRDSVQWAAPVWKRCNVTAHFPAAIPLDNVMQVLQEHWAGQSSTDLTLHETSTVPNRDWVVFVQSSWKPIVVADRFVLKFPWHTEEDVEDVKQARNTATTEWIELLLQGGIAFGTGEHATTQLCLEWLTTQSETWTNDVDTVERNVLDYGAGSGILGMAACTLGAASAVGIDIDLDACRIANANAVTNQVPMRNFLPPLSTTDADDESKSLLVIAHAYALAQVDENGSDEEEAASLFFDSVEPHQAFDVVVANILAAPLIALSSTLWGYTKPGGSIGLSGVLSKQRQDVMDAYMNVGFRNVRVRKELDGWVLITGERPTTMG